MLCDTKRCQLVNHPLVRHGTFQQSFFVMLAGIQRLISECVPQECHLLVALVGFDIHLKALRCLHQRLLGVEQFQHARQSRNHCQAQLTNQNGLVIVGEARLHLDSSCQVTQIEHHAGG